MGYQTKKVFIDFGPEINLVQFRHGTDGSSGFVRETLVRDQRPEKLRPHVIERVGHDAPGTNWHQVGKVAVEGIEQVQGGSDDVVGYGPLCNKVHDG